MSLETNPSSFLSDKIASMIWINRKAMAIICGIAFLLSVIVSFILPVKYKGTSVLFTTQSNNIGHELLSGEPDAKDYMAFGEEKSCEQMVQILNSETVMRAMAKKYDLVKYYKIAPDEPGKYALLKFYYTDNFNFDITEYQSIKVVVYDKNPEMASAMANGVVQIADSIYSRIVNERAVVAFQIVKQQFDSSSRVLTKLQDSMNYYRKQGILNYEFQVKELTKGEADAIVKGSPAQVKDMEDKLKPFQEYGKPYWDLYYALFDHYKWMQQLKLQYAEAKTNAEKTMAPFFVVEKAIVPDKKVYPIRWLVVVGGTFAGFFIGIFILLLLKRLSPGK
jgi:hypothetical protein